MKISCTQPNLIKALYPVTNIVGKNVSLPILNNLLIKAKGGVIKLMSTNLDIGIKTTLRGKIEKEGQITVPAKLLMEYINLVKEETINLEVKNEDLIIKTNKQKTVIKGQSAEEYPIIPEIKEGEKIKLSAEEFKDNLSRVIFAASYENIRQELTGVYFEIYQGVLTLAATDSYRLAESRIQLNNKEYKTTKIIPVRVLQELLRVLKTDELTLNFSDNQVFFKFEDIEITSRLIEGNYPQYNEIIPKEYKTKVKVNREEIIGGVKINSLFSKTGINDVLLDFNPQKSNVEISAANIQLGENKTVIHAEVSGENNNVVFNYKYLLDGLQNIEGKEIIMEIINSESPVIIKPGNNTEENYLYLIMPIRK